MMQENEQVPDIEKLEHQDFDLDVEEQTRLQEEGDKEVARVSTFTQYWSQTITSGFILVCLFSNSFAISQHIEYSVLIIAGTYD